VNDPTPIGEVPEFEKIARAFHDEYEAWAANWGWETNKASRCSFDELPDENRQAMLSTVRALLDRRVIYPAALPSLTGSLQRELEEARKALWDARCQLQDQDDAKRQGETEREQTINRLLARNLLTIEIEEAIRGPLSAEPDCGTCADTHWLCDECGEPKPTCIHGGNLSESGCPDCTDHPDHPRNQPPHPATQPSPEMTGGDQCE
jgi:hypothetical protein